MKSILKNWVFLFLILLLNNCGSHKPQTDGPTKPMEKAYVLLRTEGSENDITQLKNILSSDFVTNDVTSNPGIIIRYSQQHIMITMTI